MNVKHIAGALLSIVSLAVLGMAGCAADPTLDAVDVDEENLDSIGEAITNGTVTCQTLGSLTAGTYNRYTNVASTDAFNNDGAYDIRSYCTTEMNKRRNTTHTSYDNLSLSPYHIATGTSNLPNYTSATPGTQVDTTVEACRAISDAKAGGHSNYGNPMIPNAGSTAAFCPVGGATIADAVRGCLNMIEQETGFGGHQGGLLWDNPRPISCTLGVAAVNGVKKKGITIGWGQPTLRSGLANGSRCKANYYCTSGVCDTATDSRCKGASGSACLAAEGADCTAHKEDTGVCVHRGAACSSGVCKSNGTCQ